MRQRREAGQPPRAVVVVGDRLLREGIASALRAGGVSVRSGSAHAPAAGRCGGWADVTIVDVDGADGLALLEQVKACRACGFHPAVGLTTFPDPEQRRRALAAGADEIALKRAADDILALVHRLAGRGAG